MENRNVNKPQGTPGRVWWVIGGLFLVALCGTAFHYRKAICNKFGWCGKTDIRRASLQSTAGAPSTGHSRASVTGTRSSHS